MTWKRSSRSCAAKPANSMPPSLTFQENDPQAVAPGTQAELLRAVELLRKDLAPRLSQLATTDGVATLQNLVGSFRLPRGDVVEVMPKGSSVLGWSDAVVQLLEPTTRISITGSRRSRTAPRRNDLTAALALEYSRRLDRALRLAGPIEVYERQRLASRRLNGHLDVTRWVKGSVIDPSIFPVSRDELSGANDVTRALSIVAGQLSRSAVGGELSSRLRHLQTAVIPGHPIPHTVNPSVARRPLPAQWSKYRPAWDLATAIIRNHSVVGDPGRSFGLEVAVEPWPLLETLLFRTLRALSQNSSATPVRKSTHPLLLRTNGKTALNVIPDGALEMHGRVIATFECKYTVPRSTPKEDHAHQALSTAAALDSPLAVLVYPNDEAPTTYEVAGFHGYPATLVTVGLSLYDYQRGAGDRLRAEALHDLLSRFGAFTPSLRA